MHIVTVENFLCCFRLETGGYFLGYLGCFSSLITFISLVAAAIAVTFEYEEIEEMLDWPEVDAEIKEWEVKLSVDSKIILILGLVILVIAAFIYLVSCIMLIRGTKHRIPNRLVPFLVCTAIGIVLGFGQLAPLTWESLVNVIWSTIVELYIYICVYSLYIKLRHERKYQIPETQDKITL